MVWNSYVYKHKHPKCEHKISHCTPPSPNSHPWHPRIFWFQHFRRTFNPIRNPIQLTPHQDTDSSRLRTPCTFLRDYIKRQKRLEEPILTFKHINRPPPVTSQPIYTHIPEHAQPKHRSPGISPWKDYLWKKITSVEKLFKFKVRYLEN